MLSEVSQTKTNTVRYHLYVESKNYNTTVIIPKKKQTHRYREQASGYHRKGSNVRMRVQTSECKTVYKDVLYNTMEYSKYFVINCKHSVGEGNGNPLQDSCLENPMDRGAWWATVHGVVKELDTL